MTRLRSALWLPIFDELAEPAVVARLAASPSASVSAVTASPAN